MSQPQFLIVGGGLCGSYMAFILAESGFDVEVHEKRDDPLEDSKPSGRNINLGLANHSLRLLERAGLKEQLDCISVPLEGRQFHFPNGERLFQNYAEPDGPAISQFMPEAGVRAVSRSSLNDLIVQKARSQTNVKFHFQSQLISLSAATGSAQFRNSQGKVLTRSADVIIGADGVNSMVRQEMVRKKKLEESKARLEYGYKELCIPPKSNGSFAIEANALHLWPQAGYMMIALPNSDGSFRCSIFLPNEGPNSWEQIGHDNKVNSFFARSFPDVVDLMPSLESDFLSNSVAQLVTLRCWPWHEERAVLMGDACHTFLPFTGQGVNSAFEDCQTLLECLLQSAPNWNKAFSDYAAKRKEPTDVIGNTGMVMAPVLLNSLYDQKFAREIGSV